MEGLKQRLKDVGKMIETARVNVAGDKEADIAVERLALKMAALGRKVATGKIGLEGAARAEVDIAAVSLALDKLGDKSVTAKAKVESSGAGMSGALTRLGTVAGGFGAVAAGALGLGLAGPLAAATLAVGAFGAVAIPVLSQAGKAQAAVNTAQSNYGIAIAHGTSQAKAYKAEQIAIAKAYAEMSPQQIALSKQLGNVAQSWQAVEAAMTPFVAQAASVAVKFASALLPAMNQLVPAGAKVVTAVLTPMTKLFASPFFAQFIKQMSQLAVQVAPILGQALTGLLKVFMQMFMQAGPSAVKILNLLLPAIVAMASGLVPVVTLITNVVAVIVQWLAKNHLLIPALIAVGAAVAIASGGLTLIIPAIALVVGGIVHLWQTCQRFRDIVTTVFSIVARIVLTVAEIWLNEWHGMVDALLTAVHFILVGVQGMAKVIDIVMGTHLADAVGTALKNFDNFHRGVDAVFNAAHAKIESWKRDLANMPKVVKLEGNITDLTNKLNNAKAQLRDPHLTATRRAAIQANIAQLQAQLAEARRELAAINGATATTYVQTIYTHASYGGGHPLATGGITGAAGGGPRGNWTLVGEHGAELVSLPPGSMVHSNPDTQRMMAGAGGGRGIVRLEVVSGGASAFEQFMLEAIRNWVRVKGGGDVQRALGRS